MVFLNYFVIFVVKNDEENKMCKILKKIKNKTAEDLLKEYYSRDSFAVDIVEVVHNIGIKLVSTNFYNMEKMPIFKEQVQKHGNILGAVYVDKDDVTIAYSEILSYYKEYKDLSEIDKADKLKKRQRFTIAHELAHCCLHMADQDGSHIEYRDEQADYNDIKEREANIFAGELLMPTDTVKFIADFFGYVLSSVALSNIFMVSRNVVRARLNYLKEINVLPVQTKIIE